MKTKKDNFKSEIKNKAFSVVMILITVLFISCGGDDDNSSGTSGGEGEANIVLTAGGQEFKVVGPCGWAVVGGVNYIGANQSDNNLRTFSSYFNISELPDATTTYTLVDDE